MDRSERQYKRRFDRWALTKHIKRHEKQYIAQVAHMRKMHNPSKPDLRFNVRGKDLPQEKVQKFLHPNIDNWEIRK
jgi:hypothetical protein